MSELTPKERVMRLLRKEPVDTMPFFSGMGMVVMPGIEKAGIKFASVHTDPERMAWSAIWSARLMGFDCVVHHGGSDDSRQYSRIGPSGNAAKSH